MERLAEEKATIDPIAGTTALARRAHAHLLTAIMMNEVEYANAVTETLAPFIEEGAILASQFQLDE